MTITLTDLLKQEVEGAYHATEGLFKLVDKDKLGWKPATGKNWMTTGQVLHHLTNACGFCVKGFVTGDWGMPAGAKPEDMKPEDMLPPAEKLPTVKSVVAHVDDPANNTLTLYDHTTAQVALGTLFNT